MRCGGRRREGSKRRSIKSSLSMPVKLECICPVRCYSPDACTARGHATSDPPARPDLMTYSTLINGFCSNGDLECELNFLMDAKCLNELAAQ